MNHPIMLGSPILRAVAVAAATILLTVVIASGVAAQTLIAPNPQPNWSAPPAAAKSLPSAPVKPCSGFGAGFVYVPASGACIKIGGYVRTEGTAGR